MTLSGGGVAGTGCKAVSVLNHACWLEAAAVAVTDSNKGDSPVEPSAGTVAANGVGTDGHEANIAFM